MAEENRDTWNNKIEYLLTAVGYCVGLGNVWRFPFICQKFGGGTFIIPYLVMVTLAGIPAFLLEATLGQFSSQGPVNGFNGVKLLKGMGFAMLAVCVFVGVYYNVVISWIGYYIFKSFNKELPWTKCDPSWGDGTCTENYGDSINNTCIRSTTESFYYEEVLGIENIPSCNETGYQPAVYNNVSGELELPAMDGYLLNPFQFGGFQWRLVLFLVIAWVVIGLCVWKGVKTSGKLMYVITLFPYVAMTILFVKGCFMPGAGKGLVYLFKPKWEKLLSGELWLQAIGQIFFSTSIALGGVMTLASFSGFKNNTIKDTYIIVMADTLTSLYGAMTVFVYMGAMAENLHTDVENVVSPGPGLVFIVWPEAMSNLSGSWFVNSAFAVIFFAMLYFMGVSSMISLTETVVSFITDFNVELRKKRTLVVISVCSVMGLAGLPMVTKNGIYFFDIVDNFASATNLVILATIEIIVVSWVYGADRLINDLKMMTNVKKFEGLFYKILWKFVVPILNIVLLTNLIISMSAPKRNFWGNDFKISKSIFIAVPLLSAPLLILAGYAFKVINLYGFKDSKAPYAGWGPAKDEDRMAYNQLREDAIIYHCKESPDSPGTIVTENSRLKENSYDSYHHET